MHEPKRQSHESYDDFDFPEPPEGGYDICRTLRFRLGPAWRWREAERIAERGSVLASTEYDTLIWAIVEYLGGHVPDEARRRLDARPVDMGSAAEIYRNPDLSLEINARLLAAQSPQVIDALTGLADGTTQLYQDAFFDVVDCLSANVWIRLRVINATGIGPLRKALYRDAYHGKHLVAEHWLKHLRYLGQEIEHDPTTTEGRERILLELVILTSEIPLEWNPNKLAALEEAFKKYASWVVDPMAECVAAGLDDELASLWSERFRLLQEIRTYRAQAAG